MKKLLGQTLLLCLISICLSQTEYGTKGYTRYIQGSLPIILSAPHGGDIEDQSIPDRRCPTCTTVQDSYTIELTELIAAEIERVTSKKPHSVVLFLSRKKLDANREVREAALGDPLAEQVYYDFHGFLEKASRIVERDCIKGLVVDIHGQSHDEMWIEFGYLLTSSELDEPDLGVVRYRNYSSIRDLSSMYGRADFAEILRGQTSLGGRMQKKGYKSVPSHVYPGPNGGDYFSGGYITQVYGSSESGRIDAVQIESPRDVRFEENGRDRKVYADDLANAIISFYTQYVQDPETACKRSNLN